MTRVGYSKSALTDCVGYIFIKWSQLSEMIYSVSRLSKQDVSNAIQEL